MADDDNYVPDSDDLSLDDDFVLTQSKKTKATKRRQVKPKVSSEWSDEEMFKLIECVEGYPMLWNAKDIKYRNKVDRQSAWKEMESNVFDGKFSAGEIMAKWSNMRIQYRSYDAKIRKTKSGQGAVEQVRWKFFNAMDFVGRAEASQTATTVSNLVCFFCLSNLYDLIYIHMVSRSKDTCR